jgi:hypothetical protein
MILTKDDLRALVGRTLTDPRAAAHELIHARIPREALWPLLVLVVLASTLLSGGLNMLSPAEGPMAGLLSRPFISALMTFAGLAIMIFGLHWTGRMLGGDGELPEMLLVISWLQFMLFLGQIAILLVALMLPPLGALLFLAYLGFSVWMAVAFVDAVHHFDNYIKSFGVILVALVAIGIGLSILLTLVGVGTTGVSGNV